MKSETKFVIEIWDTVRDLIPAGKRDEVARVIIAACEDYGFERADLLDVMDEDAHLERAFGEVFGEPESSFGYDGSDEE